MDNSLKKRPVEILMVEDNPDDVYLTQIVLKDAKILANLTVVNDGEKAMNYLYKTGEYADVRTPDVVLLDLNLPKKDGREVLEDLKKDERFAGLPVVVLSTSAADKDIIKTYSLNANCYLVKPLDLEQILSLVNSIDNFWFEIVTTA